MKVIFVLFCVGAVLSLPIENPEPATNDLAPEEPEPPAVASRVPDSLNLPSNATSIRGEITDTFSCQDRIYGYYADVDNDCQIFHICLPVTYADGKEKMFRWSFVCPDETIFSQEHFTCIRPADWSGDCFDTEKFIDLNKQFGQPTTGESEEKIETDSETSANSVSSISESNEQTMISNANSFSSISESNEEKISTSNSLSSISESNEHTVSNADSQIKEKPLEKSFTEELQLALPESESLSYGIFNVRDPLIYRAETETLVHEDTAQSNEDNSVNTTEAAESSEFHVPTTTEESNDHSTDIWNMYTESLYDGSTIDDIVEVNAVGLQNIDGSTESLENVDK